MSALLGTHPFPYSPIPDVMLASWSTIRRLLSRHWLLLKWHNKYSRHIAAASEKPPRTIEECNNLLTYLLWLPICHTSHLPYDPYFFHSLCRFKFTLDFWHTVIRRPTTRSSCADVQPCCSDSRWLCH